MTEKTAHIRLECRLALRSLIWVYMEKRDWTMLEQFPVLGAQLGDSICLQGSGYVLAIRDFDEDLKWGRGEMSFPQICQVGHMGRCSWVFPPVWENLPQNTSFGDAGR